MSWDRGEEDKNGAKPQGKAVLFNHERTFGRDPAQKEHDKMTKKVFKRISIKGVLLAAALAAVLIAQAGISMASITFDGILVNEVGTASMDGANAQLTSGAGQAGAVWAVDPISTTSSFSETFSFSLTYAAPLPPYTTSEITTQADGITLAFQSTSNTALGGGGASLGVGGIPNAAGSAIQTWSNNRVGFFGAGQDPAIIYPSTPGSTLADYIKPAPTGLDLGNTSLLTGTETVSYNATTDTLTMTGTISDGTNVYNVSDTLSINLDLLYGANMYVGFTGGSGLGGSVQEITSWSGTNLATVPEPSTLLFLLGPSLIGLAAIRRKFKK